MALRRVLVLVRRLIVGVVRVLPLGLGTLVIGPFRVVVMWPVYRTIEPSEQRCVAATTSTI